MNRSSARAVVPALLAILLAAPHGAAQRPTRIATTAAALTTFPVFFHGRQVAIRQPFTTVGDVTRLDATAKPVFVVWRERPPRNDGEIRGDFWDVGRLQEGDTRLGAVDFRPILDAASEGRWPARDQIFVITSATLVEAPPATSPSIRAIALAPEGFENRGVTIVGRFKGSNLYGDLPQAPGKSKWDFVLHSADAAVWVTGLRPRGKGFDLDPGARVDTGRWLEVKGTVRRDGAQVWIEGESVAVGEAQEDAPAAPAPPPPPRQPPPRVIFSAPVQDDVDVDRTTPVRLQFSNDMDPKSFDNRVRVTYAAAAAGLPAPAVAATYDPGLRALEIRVKPPLERFQTVRVELLEGITATDGQPLAPWVLTFTTGG